VVLADADQPAAPHIDDGVGVAEVSFGGERRGRLAALLAVQALVGKV
jgi:hypothetical protein